MICVIFATALPCRFSPIFLTALPRRNDFDQFVVMTPGTRTLYSIGQIIDHLTRVPCRVVHCRHSGPPVQSRVSAEPRRSPLAKRAVAAERQPKMLFFAWARSRTVSPPRRAFVSFEGSPGMILLCRRDLADKRSRTSGIEGSLRCHIHPRQTAQVRPGRSPCCIGITMARPLRVSPAKVNCERTKVGLQSHGRNACPPALLANGQDFDPLPWRSSRG